MSTDDDRALPLPTNPCLKRSRRRTPSPLGSSFMHSSDSTLSTAHTATACRARGGGVMTNLPWRVHMLARTALDVGVTRADTP